MKLSDAAAILWLLSSSAVSAAETDPAARRLLDDINTGKPLVAHVIVALADNQFQGIVPVPKALGDGDKPQSNLYWGALYGVKGFLRRSPDWHAVPVPASGDPRILERVLFRREVMVNGKPAAAYLLAEAWQGRHIEGAIRQFLEMTRGQHAEAVRIEGRELAAGGAAHLVAYVGHNGLMDFAVPPLTGGGDTVPRVAVVLACYSHDYFSEMLRPHAAPLVTTTGLMAPEAYVLESIASNWFGGARPGDVVEGAAKAYASYQKISVASARRIFHRDP